LPNQKKKSSKKNKKSKDDQVEVLKGDELEQAKKSIKKMKDTLASWEVDWEFSEEKAQELYIQYTQELAEKIKAREAELEETTVIEEPTPEPANETMEGSEEEEEDDGNMFGGMMMMEDEVAAAPTPAVSTPSWSIVDLTVSKSWKGMLPKDMLKDYCKKNKFGSQVFTTAAVGSSVWRSSLKIKNEGGKVPQLVFELPENMATATRQESEHLVSVKC
jgi:hypothetical protein